jgi:hypothetical protein
MLQNAVIAYSQGKNAWSFVNNLAAMLTKPESGRAELRRFDTPEAAATFLAERCRYKGDPAMGLGDHYVDPRRLQFAMDVNTEAVWAQLFVDCDDFALWAKRAIEMIPGHRAELFTLVDFGPGTHVICVGWRPDGRAFAIDTNGMRGLPDARPATLCAIWTDIYRSLGYVYRDAVLTPAPVF